MNDPSDRIQEAFRLGYPIDDAIKMTGASAFQYHSWINMPLVIWKDGRIQKVDPFDPNLKLPSHFSPPRSAPPPWLGL